VKLRVLIFTLTLIVANLGSALALLEDADLKLNVNFDDRTARDFSGKYQSNLEGGVTWTANGKFGNGFEFDGFDDAIKYSDFFLSEDFSISLWSNSDILKKGSLISKDEGYSLSFSETGFLVGRVYDSGGESSLFGDLVFQPEEWNHITFVYDFVEERRSIMKLYVNGELDAIRTNAGSYSISSGEFSIGSSSEGNFDGVLDEILVFDRVLLDEEISAIYTNDLDFEGGKGNCPAGYFFENEGCVFVECTPYYVCTPRGVCESGERDLLCEDIKCGGPERLETAECNVDVCVPEYECEDWGECLGGKSSRVCRDLEECNAEFRPIEEAVCGDLVSLAPDEFCVPDISCEDWGECQYFDEVGGVLDGEVRLHGTRERDCRDLNGCIVNHEEVSACESLFELDLVRERLLLSPGLEGLGREVLGESCEDEILAFYREKKPVSYIGLSAWEDRKFDVSFVQDFDDFCDFCYDGSLSLGEEGVDCGGVCSTQCFVEGKGYLTEGVIGLWAVLGLLLVALVWRNRDIARNLAFLSFKGD
jgi:hypothetical protein